MKKLDKYISENFRDTLLMIYVFQININKCSFDNRITVFSNTLGRMLPIINTDSK